MEGNLIAFCIHQFLIMTRVLLYLLYLLFLVDIIESSFESKIANIIVIFQLNMIFGQELVFCFACNTSIFSKFLMHGWRHCGGLKEEYYSISVN